MILLLIPAALAGTTFGSYGRVAVSTDARGGQGDALNLVSYGTRLEAQPYLELDVAFNRRTDDGALFRAVLTPALQGDLFHYDGQWDADLAVRNLYAEAEGFTKAPISVWAGSRMLRGDDVYLLDFWPLDNLNTVGGGLFVRPGALELSAHLGLNRLVGEDWQRQDWPVAVPGGVGTEEVTVLDRQRVVGSARAGTTVSVGEAQLRGRLYGELHLLPAGERYAEADVLEALPADRGGLVGLELSGWGWGEEAFVHLWYRYASGLAAVGDLGLPTDGFDAEGRLAGAQQHRVALAANQPLGPVALQIGAYVQRFDDADADRVDWDDRWEAAVDLRPTLSVGQHLSLGLDLSHQRLRPDGLSPRTGEPARAALTKIAVIPAVQPEPGSYSRPQIRLQYIATFANEDALDLYDPLDSRTRYPVQHFVGIGAEWWINSISYR